MHVLQPNILKVVRFLFPMSHFSFIPKKYISDTSLVSLPLAVFTI